MRLVLGNAYMALQLWQWVIILVALGDSYRHWATHMRVGQKALQETLCFGVLGDEIIALGRRSQ